MKKPLKWLSVCSMLLIPGIGTVMAQDEEAPGIVPVEIYVCNYHDGKGSADLDSWSAKWNTWAESTGIAYSAWTLTPFYYGSDQDFDFIWLGVAPNGVSLGQAQDQWISNSGTLPAELAAFTSCSGHSNSASMNIKRPPDNDESTSFVLSFSDCNIAEDKSWTDVQPVLQAWSEYRTGHGSEAGMWVMWPAYGGGDAEFDFKFAVSHPNFASQGADYDQFGKEGHQKSSELFKGVLDCDESRSYYATQRRDGMPDDE